MKRPRPLPPDLSARPFDRGALADAAVPAGRLRRGDTANPYHGVHTTRPSEDVRGRCAEYRLRLRPGQLFSHVTAAQLHGLPLPPKLEHQVALDVAAVHPAGPPQTRNVIGHRLRRQPALVLLDEVPLCSPEETWCQLSARLDLIELVVIADHLLRRAALEAQATGDDPDDASDGARRLLQEAIDAPGRYRRAVLNTAVDLARWRAASPGESRTRVILVVAGIPEPELNSTVIVNGIWLGSPDMCWRSRRVMLEYEGDGHRMDQRQFRVDIDRYDAFQAAGWTVIRVTADTVRPDRRDVLVQRVATALGIV